MPDTIPGAPILIRADRLKDPILSFVSRSALSYCTTVEPRYGDEVAVVPRWPVDCFSAGEAIAWDLLESLTSGALHMAFDRLDDENLNALTSVIASAREAVKAA
jgi:hypothetical protein